VNRKQRRAAAKTGKPASPQGIADNVVQKAIAAAKAGALQEAAEALDQVLERFPNHVEALHQKGMILARTGNAEAGIAFLQRATAAKPDQPLYWNNLAAACLTCDRLDQAREAAQRAVSLDPQYVMAWRNLGTAAGALKHYAAAAQAFEKASQLAPRDADLWYQLALAQLESGGHASGRTALAKAVELAPGNAEYQSNMGILLLQERRVADALPYLERAVGLEPDRFAAALHYGICLSLEKRYEPALRWLRRATSIKPTSDVAWGALADAAMSAGETAEAQDAARRAAEFAPGDPNHRARLRKLEQSTLPRATLVELDLGSPVQFSDQGKTNEPDLSTSLDQIFIR
jgi:Flp pilus assembly protein TadD